MSGERDNRECRVPLTDRPRRLEPVHLRHLAIHQDRIELALSGRVDRLSPVRRLVEFVADRTEDLAGDQPIDPVIVNDQDPAITARLGGWGRPMGSGRIGRAGHIARSFGPNANGIRPLRDDADHRVEQSRLTNRFVQTRQFEPFPFGRIEHLVQRRQQNQLGAGTVAGPADPIGEFQPIHSRHQPIEDRDFERCSRRGRFADPPQRRRAVVFGLGEHAPTCKLLSQNLQVRVVVVDDQRADPVQTTRQPRRTLALPSDLQRQPDPEHRPFPLDTIDRDLTAHHLNEFTANRQPQPRPAVSPRRRRVDLRERSEQAINAILGDPDPGVADLDRDPCSVVADPLGQRRRQVHLAVFGELDRIAQQIDNHLAEPFGVADDSPRDRPGDPTVQLEPLRVCPMDEHFRDRLEQLG